MKNLPFLLILLLLVPNVTLAHEDGFVAGGTLTRLDQFTFRAQVWGYISEFQIGGSGPHLLPHYPYAANLDDWTLYGSFSQANVQTPFAWEAGEDWIHVGPHHSPWEDISGFTFDFYQQEIPQRFVFRIETLGHVWFDQGMDNWIAIGNLTGHTGLVADTPTTIGASTDFTATPEPRAWVSFGLGLAFIMMVGWRRRSLRLAAHIHR
jgi:hypothetical protein